MKRIFLLLLGLGLAAAIFQLGRNVWQTTQYFETQGREATLVIGKRYNAERWSSPLPIKKIYTFTAKLEPKYEVLVETDQDVKEGSKLTIRFLTRDLAPGLREFSMRPVANSLRLRGAEDGTPVKVEDTEPFDALVDTWMGPPAKGVYIRPRAKAEAAPDATKATVPFLFAPAGGGTWDILWTNSRAQEWLILGIGLLTVQAFLSAAWDQHKDARLAKKRGRGFVHPSLRKIEADASDGASKKLTYVPKPAEEIVLSESEKRRLADEAKEAKPTSTPRPTTTPPPPVPNFPPPTRAPAAPPAAAVSNVPPVAPPMPAPPAPSGANVPEGQAPSLTDRETAPPMPINRDVVLKLKRKPGGGGDSPAQDSKKSEG